MGKNYSLEVNGEVHQGQVKEVALPKSSIVINGILFADYHKMSAKTVKDLKEELDGIPIILTDGEPNLLVVDTNDLIDRLVEVSHEANKKWWQDPNTGEPIERNVGELIALVHSELSEALEAYRKDLNDDKLPDRKGIEVELADAVIRIFDMAGGLGLDLGGAFVEKMAFNANREDHKHENRVKEGGKKF